MKMEYNTEHHMFPNVPFHRLPKLHEMVEYDLPKTYEDPPGEIRHVLP